MRMEEKILGKAGLEERETFRPTICAFRSPMWPVPGRARGDEARAVTAAPEHMSGSRRNPPGGRPGKSKEWRMSGTAGMACKLAVPMSMRVARRGCAASRRRARLDVGD